MKLAWLALGFALVSAPVAAQSERNSAVPPEIASMLRDMGRVVDPPATAKLYAALQAQAPTDGVKRTADIAYGSDERHKLDLYEPTQRPPQAMPVLIFIHGGAFVGGNKAAPNSPYYQNIGTYFARHGVLTVLATYRLAPQHQWPTGAQDVGAAVTWTRDNAARFGGDTKRIVLMGHSAGAVHVAAYGLEKRRQGKSGSGLAGLVVVSGLYDPALDDMAREAFFGGQPSQANIAYYGSDPKRYAERATLRHLDAPKLPVLIVSAELDPVPMQAQGAMLFQALCNRDKACPGYIVLRDHSHMSEVYAINTPDEALAKPVLDFVLARPAM